MPPQLMVLLSSTSYTTTSMSTHFQYHAHLLSDPTHLDDIETNVFVEGEEDDESQSIVVPCPMYQQQLDQEPELE